MKQQVGLFSQRLLCSHDHDPAIRIGGNQAVFMDGQPAPWMLAAVFLQPFYLSLAGARREVRAHAHFRRLQHASVVPHALCLRPPLLQLLHQAPRLGYPHGFLLSLLSTRNQAKWAMVWLSAGTPTRSGSATENRMGGPWDRRCGDTLG